MNNQYFNCASIMWKKENKTGTLGLSAVFSIWCLEGKILLPTISDPLSSLQQLLTDETKEGKELCHNTKCFNSNFYSHH